MIKFFRKIRQNLLSENKFSKYLVYAIGEILLVVIGILIALMIDNWNDVRKSNENEVLLLNSLKSEFETNFAIFDSVHKFQITKEDYVKRLIAYNETPIPFEELDSILEIITYNYTTNLSFTIYESSVNSGKIELISNDQLKNRIASFNELFKDYSEEEFIAQDMTNEQIIPFINDHIVIRYPFGNRDEIALKKDSLEYQKLVTNVKFR